MDDAALSQDALNATDGVAFDVKEMPDPDKQLDILRAVPALSLGAAERADLADTSLPEPQNVDRDIELLSDLADAEKRGRRLGTGQRNTPDTRRAEAVNPGPKSRAPTSGRNKRAVSKQAPGRGAHLWDEGGRPRMKSQTVPLPGYLFRSMKFVAAQLLRVEFFPGHDIIWKNSRRDIAINPRACRADLVIVQ